MKMSLPQKMAAQVLNGLGQGSSLPSRPLASAATPWPSGPPWTSSSVSGVPLSASPSSAPHLPLPFPVNFPRECAQPFVANAIVNHQLLLSTVLSQIHHLISVAVSLSHTTQFSSLLPYYAAPFNLSSPILSHPLNYPPLPTSLPPLALPTDATSVPIGLRPNAPMQSSGLYNSPATSSVRPSLLKGSSGTNPTDMRDDVQQRRAPPSSSNASSATLPRIAAAPVNHAVDTTGTQVELKHPSSATEQRPVKADDLGSSAGNDNEFKSTAAHSKKHHKRQLRKHAHSSKDAGLSRSLSQTPVATVAELTHIVTAPVLSAPAASTPLDAPISSPSPATSLTTSPLSSVLASATRRDCPTMPQPSPFQLRPQACCLSPICYSCDHLECTTCCHCYPYS